MAMAGGGLTGPGRAFLCLLATISFGILLLGQIEAPRSDSFGTGRVRSGHLCFGPSLPCSVVRLAMRMADAIKNVAGTSNDAANEPIDV